MVEISTSDTYYLGSYDGVQAGSASVPVLGLEFRLRMYMPVGYDDDGPGKWCQVQLVRANVVVDGNTLWDTGSDFRLDNMFPYGDLVGPAVEWTCDGTLGGLSDSPNVPCDESVEVGIAFRMYVLFKPAGDGDWAPMWYLPWYWTAEAAESGGVWPPEPTIGDVSQSPKVTTSEHPVWTDRLVNLWGTHHD